MKKAYLSSLFPFMVTEGKCCIKILLKNFSVNQKTGEGGKKTRQNNRSGISCTMNLFCRDALTSILMLKQRLLS